ncbi:fumarylacetoacetate hydrolase family protein [Nitratifractor salsuginis]|uniref:Fumarylacetoacetate (FAA) hydrolase n=1 Tax=Nitratifractor salsuginis (strain DSM 16511 / JCM 12458 / E9I37-1) TaxID=749222 RepID=E6X183_NITSE|nr:fumarylacetoacetate hydrolase family protein [Nitratifractor salsuginis]ADV46945.1 fumarylacetoacetate (FAA) hydrolase [Nitratifractor salsuginis DSM 16511]
MNTIQMGKELLTPSKVVCIGRNYVEHIEELGNEMPEDMVIFNKPNSAVTDTLRAFRPDTRFEGELCLLIRSGEIAGIGFGLDLTHAEIQNRLKAKGLPWERAKAFDGAAVLSHFVPFEGKLEDLRFELYHNGKLAQHASYDLMIYKPQKMLREIQSFMTLEDGDIIMTGTPKGVSTYERSDRFIATVYEGEREIVQAEWICQ